MVRDWGLGDTGRRMKIWRESLMLDVFRILHHESLLLSSWRRVCEARQIGGTHGWAGRGFGVLALHLEFCTLDVHFKTH